MTAKKERVLVPIFSSFSAQILKTTKKMEDKRVRKSDACQDLEPIQQKKKKARVVKEKPELKIIWPVHTDEIYSVKISMNAKTVTTIERGPGKTLVIRQRKKSTSDTQSVLNTQ